MGQQRLLGSRALGSASGLNLLVVGVVEFFMAPIPVGAQHRLRVGRGLPHSGPLSGRGPTSGGMEAPRADGGTSRDCLVDLLEIELARLGEAQRL